MEENKEIKNENNNNENIDLNNNINKEHKEKIDENIHNENEEIKQEVEAKAKPKVDPKYLKGAVPEVDGQVVFSTRIEAPGKTKAQLYVALNYWVTATFKDKQAITLNDKDMGCIIVSSTIDAIADHTGTLNRYVVSITPVIKIDIKDGRVRVTYTVQNYDILKAEDAGWLGGLADNTKYTNQNQNIYSDGKRLKGDKTDHRLYDEQWEIAKHYPFVEKDSQKRTCSKALVMTHAYSNAIIDKVEEAIKNGIVGNEDEDW